VYILKMPAQKRKRFVRNRSHRANRHKPRCHKQMAGNGENASAPTAVIGAERGSLHGLLEKVPKRKLLT